MNVGKVIGRAALLELMAEECSEMAQACLKMARKLRKENPTPLSEAEIWEHVNEEAADVEICIESLLLSGVLSRSEMNAQKKFKEARWEERLKEKENKNG